MSLASAIRAAVGGRAKKPRLEDERPEDLEDENKPEDAETEEEESAEEHEDENPEADEADLDVEDDKDDNSNYARGRKAERRRMSAILGSAKAEANPKLAAHLAFNTSMSARQAVATLSAAGGGAENRPSLAQRMQGRVPLVGNGGARPTAKTGDDALIAHAQSRAEARKRR